MDLKVSYRVSNWKSYNAALRRRGDLTIWFTADSFSPPKQSGKGRPFQYSDGMIEMALALRYLFKLTLRSTQGFIDSLLRLQDLPYKCCDYTLLSKRAAKIGQSIAKLLTKKDIRHIAVDSTGLKVFGDGEWKVRIHGSEKRRTWRKLHIATDLESHRIVGHILTDSATSDGRALPHALATVGKIERAYADGAYDQMPCYEEFCRHGARPVIPPRKGSKQDKVVWSIPEQWRSINVKSAHDFGLAAWKAGVSYHRRSLIETSIGRFKRMFTGTLASRSWANQVAEAQIKVEIFNRITRLGMPKTRVEKSWVA